MSSPAPPVDLTAVRTWEQAVQALPCPDCSDRWDSSPGFVTTGSHGSVGVCRTCQPEHIQDRFRHMRRGSATFEVALRLIDRRYPVRYTWDWEPRIPVVRDRASGEAVWTGGPHDDGYDARREIARLNEAWYAQLDR